MDRDYRTLWCGNLSNRVNEDILYELFLQAGPLDEVKIPKDRDNRPRGYGFVTYKHNESVDYALELFKGTNLYNRELCIDRKLRAPQEQPAIHNHDAMGLMFNGGGNGIFGMMPGAGLMPAAGLHRGNAYPNPYASHTQLGYQGPANMYPSKDRRNSSRKHPYNRY